MWMFFHRLLNPHCPDCRRAELELIQARINKEDREREDERLPYDSLKEQLEISNRERDRLLTLLIDKSKPEERINTTPEVINRTLPWRVKQAQLERESRMEAQRLEDLKTQQILAAKNKTDKESIDDIEREVLEVERTNANS